MAEMDLGIREFTDDEKKYIWKRATGFRDWLIAKCNKTLEEAREICRRCYDKDVELLLQTDPYADFVWSRGEEAGDMELDILKAIDNDPEGTVRAEHLEFHRYWREMELTAERNVNRYPDEVWAASREKFNEIMEFLIKLDTLPGGSKRNSLLAKTWRRLVELRRGKEPILMWRHFAICRNVMDEMRGIKRPKLVVQCKEEELNEDSIDQHDAMSLIVHGLEVEELTCES